MKEFGLQRSAHWPIVAPTIWRSWSRTSSNRSTGFVTQPKNCGDVLCNPNCLLFCASLLHSLCSNEIGSKGLSRYLDRRKTDFLPANAVDRGPSRAKSYTAH